MSIYKDFWQLIKTLFTWFLFGISIVTLLPFAMAFFIFLVFVDSPVALLFFTTLCSIIIYPCIFHKSVKTIKKYKSENEYEIWLIFLNLKYQHVKLEEDKSKFFTSKDINQYFDFFGKFATVSALITFSLLIIAKKIINVYFAIPILFVANLMLIHYWLSFSVYLTLPTLKDKDKPTGKLIIFIKSIFFTILMVALIFIIITLSLMAIDKQELFCHTEKLILVLDTVSSICRK